jgi:peroxiredoxin
MKFNHTLVAFILITTSLITNCGKKATQTTTDNNADSIKKANTEIQGQIVEYANKDISFDKIGGASIESLGTFKTDAQGQFTAKIALDEAAVVRVRVGKFAFPMILNPTQQTNITWSPNVERSFVVNSEDSKELRDLLYSMEELTETELLSNAEAVKHPLTAWYITRNLSAKNKNVNDFHKRLVERMQNEMKDNSLTKAFTTTVAYNETVINAQPIKVGSTAPNFTMLNTNDKPISLSDLKGKVVLIDFWASWCGPCRASNPELVRIYNRYKNKGFTVLSVSLDKDKNAWTNAIAHDKLEWPTHCSELKFWYGSVNQLYGVNSIPQTFLIDKKGQITALNLHGSDLEVALDKLLK